MMGAFQKGVEGVYVVGCQEGECHFLKGNLRAKKRVEYTKKLFDEEQGKVEAQKTKGKKNGRSRPVGSRPESIKAQRNAEAQDGENS